MCHNETSQALQLSATGRLDGPLRLETLQTTLLDFLLVTLSSSWLALLTIQSNILGKFLNFS